MSRFGKDILKRKKYTNWNENLIDQLDCKAERAAERVKWIGRHITGNYPEYNIQDKEMKNMKIDQMIRFYLCLLRVPSGKKKKKRVRSK